jgi:cobalt-zinc-cadmium efflux system membrane fusion protein
MKRITFLMMCGLLLSCGKPKPSSQTESKAENGKAEKQETASEADEKSKGEGTGVEMTPEAQARSGIVVSPAAAVPMIQYLQVTGSVQPVDSSVAHIRSLARGRLQEVLAKVGDRVAAGQVLAQLDNIEAGELVAQYNSAGSELQRLKIQVAAQQRQVERNRRLAEIGASPQKDYELSLAEQQGLEEGVRAQESAIAGLSVRLRRFGISEADGNTSSATAIRAPFAGLIIRMSAAPGDVVEAGADLFTVADLSTVYIQGQVYEKDLGGVRVGQQASVTIDAYPGEHFSGRVVSIGDLIDPQTRTAAVRCQVANPNARLKLDMLAMIAFPTSARRAALAVPSDAVQMIEGKTVVFVRSSSSRFSIRPVEAGLTSEGRTQIIRGLNEGEPVVTKGAFAVKSALLSKELGEGKE